MGWGGGRMEARGRRRPQQRPESTRTGTKLLARVATADAHRSVPPPPPPPPVHVTSGHAGVCGQACRVCVRVKAAAACAAQASRQCHPHGQQQGAALGRRQARLEQPQLAGLGGVRVRRCNVAGQGPVHGARRLRLHQRRQLLKLAQRQRGLRLAGAKQHLGRAAVHGKPGAGSAPHHTGARPLDTRRGCRRGCALAAGADARAQRGGGWGVQRASPGLGWRVQPKKRRVDQCPHAGCLASLHRKHETQPTEGAKGVCVCGGGGRGDVVQRANKHMHSRVFACATRACPAPLSPPQATMSELA